MIQQLWGFPGGTVVKNLPAMRETWVQSLGWAPAACSFPGENARSWGALGEARPGQSSLSAGALRYRAWAQIGKTDAEA